jgi:hypothetical protein
MTELAGWSRGHSTSPFNAVTLISGGHDPVPDEETVRQRVRVLLDRGALPSIRPGEIWGGASMANHACTVCGVKIGVGEVKFDIPPPNGVVVPVHRHCFAIWTQEAAEREACR